MAKKLDIKIRETKDLEAAIWCLADCHCLSHDYASFGVGTRLDVTQVACGRMWKSAGRGSGEFLSDVNEPQLKRLWRLVRLLSLAKAARPRHQHRASRLVNRGIATIFVAE